MEFGFLGQVHATYTDDAADKEDIFLRRGHIILSGEVVDSENWVLDVRSGYAVGPCGLALNAAWYTWDNSAFEGNTAFVEGGVLVGRAMATGKDATQDPDNKVQHVTCKHAPDSGRRQGVPGQGPAGHVALPVLQRGLRGIILALGRDRLEALRRH